jgi:5-methylcytosine-specific restriction endonuclease McrA
MMGSSNKVLVLNSDYRAFSICSVYKAFILIYLDKAELVSSSKKLKIRSIDRTFDVPSVIKLRQYVNMPYRHVMLSRQNVFKRDGQKCVYCGSKNDLTIDHVLPKSRGGRTTWGNLVTACKRCNTKKGDFLPEEANMILPFKPFKPSFIMFLRDYSGLGDESWHPYLGQPDAS